MKTIILSNCQLEFYSFFSFKKETHATGSQEPTCCRQLDVSLSLCWRPLPTASFYDLLHCSRRRFDRKYRYIRKLGATDVKESQYVSQYYLAKKAEDPFFKCVYFFCGIVSAPENLDYILRTQYELIYQLERNDVWCLGSLFALYITAWTIYNSSEYSYPPNPTPYILLLLPKQISLTKEGAMSLIDHCIDQTNNVTDFILKPYFHITKCRWEFEQYKSQQALDSTHIRSLLERTDATIRMCKGFDQDWMKAHSFGAMVSAVNLKIEIALCCFSDQDIFLSIKGKAQHLLEDLTRCFEVNQALISKYDEAWFLSVQSKCFRLEGNETQARECASNSAHRYLESGRNWRAVEEARHTGDVHLIKYCEKKAQPRVQ